MTIRQFVAAFAASCLLAATMPGPAYAGMIGTQEYLAASDRNSRLARIDAVLDRAEVRDQLVALGVEPESARLRVAALADAELAAMADQLENLPAGGDALAVIGAVFLVLLVLEVAGVINIFRGT